jgi:hypothetical protein
MNKNAPWSVSDTSRLAMGNLEIIDSRGNEVAHVYHVDEDYSESIEYKSIANLLAAAPDLLEALQELDECYCEAGNDLSKEDRHRHRMALIKARAAITKATQP